MVATPIPLQDLLDESGAGTPADLPAGTEMGHVQLKVTDAGLTDTKRFYRDLLGLEINARLGDGFIGVGVADYRSLLVFTNRFSPQGGTPAGPDTARLTCVDLTLPTPQAIKELAGRLDAAAHPHQHDGHSLTVHDPSGNRLRFSPSASGRQIPNTAPVTRIPVPPSGGLHTHLCRAPFRCRTPD